MDAKNNLDWIRVTVPYRLILLAAHSLVVGLLASPLVLLAAALKFHTAFVVAVWFFAMFALVVMYLVSGLTLNVLVGGLRGLFTPNISAQIEFSKMFLRDLIHPFSWRRRM
jgi:hypothetical protein